jgi:hypothetical protein
MVWQDVGGNVGGNECRENGLKLSSLTDGWVGARSLSVRPASKFGDYDPLFGSASKFGDFDPLFGASSKNYGGRGRYGESARPVFCLGRYMNCFCGDLKDMAHC